MTEVADYRFHTHGMDVEPFVKGNAKVQTYKGAYISITDKCNTDVLSYGAGPRHSRLVSVQYAAIAAMKNDMRSATPATAAIMVA